MTSMLGRPAAAARGAVRSRADVVATRPVAAVTAAVWSALLSLLVLGVVVTLLWAFSGRGDDGLGTPLAATGVVWLSAQLAPVTTPIGDVTLTPTLLLALILLLLWRSGAWAARATSTTRPADVGLVVVTGTATYAFLAWVVGQVSAIGPASVPMAASVLGPALVAAVGLGLGAAHGAGLLRSAAARLPVLVRRALRAAAASTAALLLVGALVSTVAVLARLSTVSGLSSNLASTAWDAAGVAAVTLAYVPTLVVWGLAYAAGPGFTLGGATFDPFVNTGGLVPGLPVLGAIPDQAAAAAPLLLLLPVAAGVVGSVVLRRRGGLVLQDEALALLLGAALTGLAVAVLCRLASGSLGSGQLAVVGPNPVTVGLAVTGLVAAGALLWSLLRHALPSLWVRETPH